MTSSVVLFAVVLILAGVQAANVKSYKGYKVVRAVPETLEQVKFLHHVQESSFYGVDFWTEVRREGHFVDMMVAPQHFISFVNGLQKQHIKFDITIEDVEDAIRAQRPVRKDPRTMLPLPWFKPSTPAGRLTWTDYHSLAEINTYLNQVQADYPSIASVSSIGSSYEGRSLNYIKIGSAGSNKPAIWIDGGIHAREWISPAFVTYVIEQLTKGYGSDAQITSFVDNLDFYIAPVLNPDGYEYTWTTDRMWRKTRRPNEGSICVGTDPNRNFDFHWNEGGASDSPCAEDYHGPAPFSESETAALRDFLLPRGSQFMSYLTFHSYGQYFLTPWGYTTDLPADYPELIDLANRAYAALYAVDGTKYTLGSSTNVLYIASGGSDDWAKGAAGIKYVYTIELRDTGRYGFTLPVDQITPTCIETWEAVKVICDELF